MDQYYHVHLKPLHQRFAAPLLLVQGFWLRASGLELSPYPKPYPKPTPLHQRVCSTITQKRTPEHFCEEHKSLGTSRLHTGSMTSICKERPGSRKLIRVPFTHTQMCIVSKINTNRDLSRPARENKGYLTASGP